MTCRKLATYLVAFVLSALPTAQAITIRVSSDALQRTLQKQLFKDAENRYFIRGHSDLGCFIYAEEPKVSFRDNRVVVHVKTRARLGTAMHSACIGVGLRVEADVTLLPEAQGETIGFHDPRVENLSEYKELNVFLDPFLSRKLPQEMKLNAAELLRQALASSKDTTGYDLRLPTLTIRSMQVIDNALVLDVDGALEVK